MTDSEAVHELLAYIDSAHLDPEYAELLIDKVSRDAVERARDIMVKALWKQQFPDVEKARPGVSQAYVGGWDDATATAVENIKGMYLHTCVKCAKPIAYIECPTGGWWAHYKHPQDEHDAVPVR